MDGTYAPQSPDLSGFQSSSRNPPPIYQPAQTSYAPRSPVIPSYDQQHPFSEPNIPHNRSSSYEFSQYSSTQYMPPIPALPQSHSFNTATYQPPPDSHNKVKLESPKISSQNPPKAMASDYKNPNPTNIEIKTKFPVARIKRIMQADEEVGKVAQVTPVAVNKALELFMIALVTGAAERAKEKGGKRVTAQHLKAVVEGDDQFDFLQGIVERVADAPEAGEGRKKRKEGTDTEDDVKPKKGKGRRKKSDD